MTSDLDIYRSSNLLVEQHGDEAPIHAAMRADAMLDRGDLDGQAVWLRILAAVKELLDTRCPRTSRRGFFLEPATWCRWRLRPRSTARSRLSGDSFVEGCKPLRLCESWDSVELPDAGLATNNVSRLRAPPATRALLRLQAKIFRVIRRS